MGKVGLIMVGTSLALVVFSDFVSSYQWYS